MGIFKTEAYGLKCDLCGQRLEDFEINLWCDDVDAEECAECQGWEKVGDKWFCDECWEEMTKSKKTDKQ